MRQQTHHPNPPTPLISLSDPPDKFRSDPDKIQNGSKCDIGSDTHPDHPSLLLFLDKLALLRRPTMEEEKAAAYYDELSRKGEGAAKFKQGLGFSSQRSSDPFSSSKAASSLFSNFVRASSPGKEAEVDKKAALESIQNKLKKSRDRSPSPRSRGRDDRHSRGSRRRSSSRERGGRERHDRERRRRSRSDSGDESRSGRRRRSRRSRSPHGGGNRDRERSRRSPKRESSKSKNVGVDYSQLIEGYAQMVSVLAILKELYSFI